MINEILIPAIWIGAIGLFFGLVLAISSIIFKVEKDERIDKVLENLPGANCGGCTYAGCQAFAEAVVLNGERITKCNLMTKEIADKIASIMGVEAGEIVKKKAFVRCQDDCNACSTKCEIFGMDDCFEASSYGVGPKDCEYGCLGLGSCVKVCSENAISIIDGIAKIDQDKCIGCGKCASVCPKGLISLISEKRCAIVKCSSKDKGVVVKNYCSQGCIGCKLCEKKCPKQAINVVDNLARIDYNACVGCGLCVSACPKGVIEVINK